MKSSGEQRQVLDHWLGILAMRATATKNEKIREGALKRYIGWGRVPTKNVGACAKRRLGVLS
jgi:hypothetical protein